MERSDSNAVPPRDGEGEGVLALQLRDTRLGEAAAHRRHDQTSGASPPPLDEPAADASRLERRREQDEHLGSI